MIDVTTAGIGASGFFIRYGCIHTAAVAWRWSMWRSQLWLRSEDNISTGVVTDNSNNSNNTTTVCHMGGGFYPRNVVSIRYVTPANDIVIVTSIHPGNILLQPASRSSLSIGGSSEEGARSAAPVLLDWGLVKTLPEHLRIAFSR